MKQYVVGTLAIVIVLCVVAVVGFGAWELLGIMGIHDGDARIGTLLMGLIVCVIVGVVAGEIGKEILKSRWWGRLESWVGDKWPGRSSDESDSDEWRGSGDDTFLGSTS